MTDQLMRQALTASHEVFVRSPPDDEEIGLPLLHLVEDECGGIGRFHVNRGATSHLAHELIDLI
jgi:hypothetical protein